MCEIGVGWDLFHESLLAFMRLGAGRVPGSLSNCKLSHFRLQRMEVVFAMDCLRV